MPRLLSLAITNDTGPLNKLAPLPLSTRCYALHLLLRSAAVSPAIPRPLGRCTVGHCRPRELFSLGRRVVMERRTRPNSAAKRPNCTLKDASHPRRTDGWLRSQCK